jgi:hypothetical protein
MKPTYYDILKKARPKLFKFVNKEKEIFKNKKNIVPFGSVDEFSEYFQRYIEEVGNELAKDFKLNLLKQGYTNTSDTELLEYIRNSPDFESLIFSESANYLTVFNFENFGRKTFFFSENLVEHLALTELVADSSFVKPPFDTCLFIYSDQTSLDAFYKIDGRECPDYEAPISVFITNRPAEEGLRKVVFACWHAAEPSAYMFVKRELLVRENWTINDMLKTDWEDIYKEEEDEYEADEISSDDCLFYNEGFLFFRILINSLLYLGSNDIDIMDVLSPHQRLIEQLRKAQLDKTKKKIRKKIKKIVDVSELNFSKLGHNTGKIVVKKPTISSNQDQESEESRKLVYRFLVRGHWRNQPFGEKRSKRKLIWIKPHYKGPDFAELVNKPYVAK